MKGFVRTTDLARLVDPFRDVTWIGIGSEPISRSDVGDAITAGVYEAREYAGPSYGFGEPDWSRDQHARRIAWFVVHGWIDSIQLDVGVPSLGYYVPRHVVADGNHRLAAAIYRSDELIEVSVSGSLAYFDEILGWAQVPTLTDLCPDPESVKKVRE